jgi:hypothetical protein
MGAGCRPAIMQTGAGCISLTATTGEMCVHRWPAQSGALRLGDVFGVGTRARVTAIQKHRHKPKTVTERLITHV